MDEPNRNQLPIQTAPSIYYMDYRSKRGYAIFMFGGLATGFTLFTVGMCCTVFLFNYANPFTIGLSAVLVVTSIWFWWVMRFLWESWPIVLSENGMRFSRKWDTDLLERVDRQWSDLHSVQYNGSTRPGDIAEWQVLEGSSITMDFKSGGFVLLEVDRLTRHEVENLFLWIERYTDQSVFSKQALLFERNLLALDETTTATSYTAIWTDALESQFAATHFMPLKTGARLQHDRYEVRVQLASSGMSAVYLAKQGARKIILKESVLPVDTDERTRAKAKELFEREARLLSKLNHDQIAKVLDYFIENGRDYIALEYIPGMSLRQLVQSDPARCLKSVQSWALQMAEILSYLHALEPPIIHRDLTPDNLIVREDGKIALIDFGVSNEFISKATGTMVGKQAYIPPEQFRGKAEPKSDIYALGATIYFILTSQDPEPLSLSHPQAVATAVPDDLDQLVARCTNLEPQNRPDAGELIRACEDLNKEKAL